jgi:CRP-like cAMP-binding protein
MPSEDKLWYLKNFDIFKSIPDQKIEEIAGKTSMRDYGKNEQIYQQNASVDIVYVIKQGEVLLLHENAGRKRVFDTLGAGSFFGSLSPKKIKISHSAEAALPSKICAFPKEVIYKIIASYPEVMLEFWQEVASRINDYENRLSRHNAPAGEIIFAEIQELLKIRQKGFLGLIKRPLVITHEELARRTGLNRVTVTRELNKLKNSGKIQVSKKSGAIELV